MKRIALAVACLVSAPAFAQNLELPRPSPTAKVMQTVGLTEIAVDYSSPAVRGRKIWGGVVPYAQVWRAGANAATKLTLSKDATVGTVPLTAGSYSIYVQPNEKAAWTVIINKDVNSGANHKKEADVGRFDVKPVAAPMRERLSYNFGDFTNDNATLNLEWEKVRLPIPVKVNTEQQVQANLKSLEENAWMPYNSVARYQLEQKKDYDAGLKFVDRSLQIKEDWFNTWTKAQLLAAKGQYKQAYPLAQKADSLGQTTPQRFFFADEVKQALSDWKAKM